MDAIMVTRGMARMHNPVWYLASAMLALSAWPGEGVPEAILQSYRDVTAVLQCGQTRVAGALFRVDGETGYVATDLRPIPSQVLSSGQLLMLRGALSPCKVISRDPASGLGILVVKRKGLPKPPPCLPGARFAVGQTVYAMGGDPGRTIAVRMFTITSVREDERKEPLQVLLDAPLLPGHSGGPVFDPAGNFLGLAFDTGNRDSSALVPLALAEELLKGRAWVASSAERMRQQDRSLVEVTVPVADPLKQTLALALIFTALERVKAAPLADALGNWPVVATQMSEVPLAVAREECTANLVLQHGPKGIAQYVLQVKLQRLNGQIVHSAPVTLTVPGGRMSLQTAAATPPKDLTQAAAKEKEEDWLGPNAKGTSQAPATLSRFPTPTAPMSVCVRDRWIVPALRVNAATGLREEDPAVPRLEVLALPLGHLVHNAVWTDGGTHACLLESSGVLRKLSVPDMKEVLRIDLGGACCWLEGSGEGLLVLVASRQEVWVLDPQTFRFRKNLPVATSRWLLSAPNLSVAFALDPTGRELRILDLAKGTTAKACRVYELSATHWDAVRKPADYRGRPSSWRSAGVTADGRFLIVFASDDFARLRISGTELEYEEVVNGPRRNLASPRTAAPPWLAFIKGAQPLVCRVPVLGVAAEKCREAEGTATDASGAFYGVYGSSQRSLLRWTAQGEVEGPYPIPGKWDEGGAGVSVHPKGRKLFYLAAARAGDGPVFFANWLSRIGTVKP